MGYYLDNLKRRDRERLTRLYEALCRFDWPETPEGQLVPDDENDVIVSVVRPPVTPERIAGVITDTICLETNRFRLLEVNEAVLAQLVKDKESGTC